MIEVSNPATILYSHGSAGTSDAQIYYAYTSANLQENDLDIVYGWGLETDRWDRKVGFWAMSTQEIGNMFPRWHAARLNSGGDTQELINGWGIGFDKAKLEFGRFRKDLFVDTAELEQPDLFHHAGTVDFKGDPEKDRSRNLLRNPSFALRGLARRGTPLSWSTWRAKTTGTVELVEQPVFVGSNSARLHADAGERCYLGQTIQASVEKGYSLTASLWYMVPIPEGTLERSTGRACLYLSIIYTNGSADIERVPLDLGTGGKWRRASVTIDLEKELFSTTFMVQIENDGEDDDVRVYAGAAQLEASPVATPWGESTFTVLPYQNEEVLVGPPVDAYVDLGTEEITETIVAGNPVTYTARTGRSLVQVKDHFRLWYDAVPMRVTATLSGTPPAARVFDQWGWYANAQKERYNTRWRIVGNKLEQYNSEIPGEIACAWDIGELHLDEDFRLTVGIYSSEEDPGFSRTIEALCIFKDRLWVLCKEVEGDVTTRVLKVVDPWSRWPIPTIYDQGKPSLHLECIGDASVGIHTGVADFLGVVVANPDQMLMKVSGVYYVLDLEFDHFVFDFPRGQVITRTVHEDGELITV